MIDLFECCADIASAGIIIDFTEDTETYIVGSPADIKTWAYGGCPRKTPKGLMRHSNKIGNLVKDINRLMKVKRELNESHDHHFKWWFEISPIRALLQARPKGRISQANYRLPLKEVIYAYLLAWFLLLVRQYTF